MATLDPHIQRCAQRVRRRYEIQRIGFAILGVIPIGIAVAVACWQSHRMSTSAMFGAAAIVSGAIMLWIGRDAQRAVLPALMAGAIPLTLALWANQSHGCCTNGGTCMAGMSSMCLPACSAGGLAAGLVMAFVGHRWNVGRQFWMSSTAVTMLVGAMGCACVGYTGVVGLAVGYGIGMLPLRWLR
jgi:hypothetical protein